MLEVFGSGYVSGGRSTYGWYVARAEMCVNAMVFLVVLQVQLAAILRRAARSGERAHVLYEIVALGTDGSRSSIDAMLARAARDLDFDWAFLARLEGDMVTVESDISGGPFTAGFRTPLSSTILRHAIERDEIFAVDDIANSKWADDRSGAGDVWASFVAVPVHVDAASYGTIGFAKARRRDKPLNDADLAFVRLVGVLAGSTIERARQREHLDGLAFFDALTGLPNRALLLKRIDQLLAAAVPTTFALQFVDLDDFKAINDTYGHAAGDAVLLELGRRLTQAVRSSDTVARWGGDEFVVLMPEVERFPSVVPQSIRAAFDEPFEIDGHLRWLGASIGVSHYPKDGATAVDLLSAADRELYRAKGNRALG
jgi:diguanylate cyclase (GGDEF)-like protein